MTDPERIAKIQEAACTADSVPAKDALFLVARLRMAQDEIDTLRTSLMEFFQAVEKLVETSDFPAELEAVEYEAPHGETAPTQEPT